MPEFLIYDLVTRKVLRDGFVARHIDLALQAQPGEGMLEGVRAGAGKRITLEHTVEDIPPEVPTLTERREQAKIWAAKRRWEVEVGGVAFGGATIATDDRSKLLLSSAAERSKADPEFTAEWKMSNDTWVSLNAAQLIAAYGAVFNWVSLCFAREKELCELIDEAADADAVVALTAAIQAFWPA